MHEISGFEGCVGAPQMLPPAAAAPTTAVLDGIDLVILGIPAAGLWALLAFITSYVPNVGFLNRVDFTRPDGARRGSAEKGDRGHRADWCSLMCRQIGFIVSFR